MPRHNMIIGGKRSPERLMGRSPGGSKASFAGVQSPPLRGEASALRMAFRGKPGVTLGPVFSEGRGLRVRIAGPHGRQGPLLPPMVRREAGGLMEIHEDGLTPPLRACGARPLVLGRPFPLCGGSPSDRARASNPQMVGSRPGPVQGHPCCHEHHFRLGSSSGRRCGLQCVRSCNGDH